MKVIARIENDLTTKFGIPRQPGLVGELRSKIVFEPEYRNADAVRGLEDFTHIWLIWEFSEAKRDSWSPTVRPPRLGGNERMGVFATRSPFRPNPVGLSAVKLIEIKNEQGLGPVLYVSGADLMNGTPIYDIKPYVPYSDRIEEATGGFTDNRTKRVLEPVVESEEVDRALHALLNEQRYKALFGILSQDPRPSYQEDPERVYGFEYAGHEVKFRAENGKAIILDIK